MSSPQNVSAADRAYHRASFVAVCRTAADPIQELNDRCITALIAMAAAPTTQTPELVLALLPQLSRLERPARQRAAGLPVLLLNMGFQNNDRWRSIATGRDRGWPSSNRTQFPSHTGVPLARAALTVIWTIARSRPHAACLLGGLTYPVAEAIAAMKMSELERIAEEQHTHLRPRWEDRPVIWRRLLKAVMSEDAAGLVDFRLHALQLLAADFARSTQSRRGATIVGLPGSSAK